jgi:hypothetical protein
MIRHRPDLMHDPSPNLSPKQRKALVLPSLSSPVADAQGGDAQGTLGKGVGG